jgi:electron transport complex protein RnfD
MSMAAESAANPRMLRTLLLALLPGIAVQSAVLGAGVLLNLALCMLACVAIEALALRFRGDDLLPQLRDGSAALSGLLLGLALPPQGPWWLPLLGGVLAIGIGKQLFGPRGQSPFNPAMVGLALLLVCIPQAMTRWLPELDGVSSATLLDHVRTDLRLARTLDEILGDSGLRRHDGTWINLAFLAGGLWLLRRGLIPWQIPIGVLAGLALPALVFWAGDTSRHASPLFHLFSGATMLSAFFIASAPPSSPGGARARLLYGFGVGAGVYAIRSWGQYPDGFAFAVLLFNAAAPALDRWAGPRTPSAAAKLPRWLLPGVALVVAVLAMATSALLRERHAAALPDLAEFLPDPGYDPTPAAEVTHDDTLGNFTVYRLRRDQGVIAILLRTSTADGYSGDIEVLTAIRADGRIAGVRVLRHRETAGIGDRIETAQDPWVLGFTGRSLGDPAAEAWRLRKDGGDIDQLSGATVSARAVTAAVHRSLEYFAAHRAKLGLTNGPPATSTN